ncbi:hypothetical protein CEP51_003845 [Fusarium floridanum]|uniref:Transcription factor domain-containing protein n=1 Tax=Fusarium floridanum TaxID=1325733 RepID=A0A428S3X6_9HYPO|nr:hypothetical protein CEP51_003845 [Fusarium floridanum]
MSFPEFLFVLLLFRSAKLSALLQQICENSQLLSSVEAPPLRAPTHTPTPHILTGSPSLWPSLLFPDSSRAILQTGLPSTILPKPVKMAPPGLSDAQHERDKIAALQSSIRRISFENDDFSGPARDVWGSRLLSFMSDSLQCSPGTEPTVDHLAKFCQSLPGMLPRKFNFPEWVLTYDDTHQLALTMMTLVHDGALLDDHSVDGEKLLAAMQLTHKMTTGFLQQAIDFGADVWDYRLHSLTAVVLLVTTGAKAADMLRVNEWKDITDNKCLLWEHITPFEDCTTGFLRAEIHFEFCQNFSQLPSVRCITHLYELRDPSYGHAGRVGICNNPSHVTQLEFTVADGVGGDWETIQRSRETLTNHSDKTQT